MLNIIQIILPKLFLLKSLFFSKNDLNKAIVIMINTFFYYIEKIEGYLDKYIFLVYIYVKFSYYLVNIYFMNLKVNFYPWNSIKFVNQTWNTYNSKFYNFKPYNILF